MSVIVALLVGYPCFHLRIVGHYFALLTLALTEFVRLVIVGLREFTGGSLGTQPKRYGDGISLYAIQFEPDRMLSYYVALALWAVGLYIWWRVDRSMDRYALDAASQDEDAAASVGIDVTREKLKITAISAGDVRGRRRDLRRSTRCISGRTRSRGSAFRSTSCSR